MIYIGAMFLLSWVMVFLMVPLIVKLAEKINTFDLPSNRKVHQRPIPRLGGLAFFSVFLIPFTCFYLYLCYSLNLPLNHIFYKPEWLGIIGGGFVIFITGLIDDLWKLKATTKLFFQIVGALCAFSGGLNIEKLTFLSEGYLSLPLYFSMGLTVLWFLIVINGFNFIDGIDGLAAGTAFLCSFFILLFAFQNDRYYMALPAVMVAGSTLGFLYYNSNPARIFMGDSGSYFLGYTMAAMAIKVARSEEGIINIFVPFMILFVPIVEVLVTVARRLIERERLFKPDTNHIHHCLLKKGFSPRLSAFILYGVTFLGGVIAISYKYLTKVILSIELLGFLCLFVILSFWTGYLNPILQLRFIKKVRALIKAFLFKLILYWNLFLLKEAKDPKKMAKILTKILSYMKIEQAKLTIFSPPIQNNPPEETEISYRIYEDKERVVNLSFPIVRKGCYYGNIEITKNLLEVKKGDIESFTHQLASIINKIAFSKICQKTSMSSSWQESKRITYTLIERHNNPS